MLYDKIKPDDYSLTERDLRSFYNSYLEQGLFCEREASYTEYRDTMFVRIGDGQYDLKMPLLEQKALFGKWRADHQDHAPGSATENNKEDINDQKTGKKRKKA